MGDNRLTEEQAKKKLAAARRHTAQERAELERLKPSKHIELNGGGGFAYTCERCAYYLQCRETVRSGALLPCQPQDQEPVLAVRESGDYAQDWRPQDGYRVNRDHPRRKDTVSTN